MSEFNCSNCPYSRSVRGGPQALGQSQLFCYRFPPQVVAIQTPSGKAVNGSVQMSVSIKPQGVPVSDQIWCYEHPAINLSQSQTQIIIAEDENGKSKT